MDQIVVSKVIGAPPCRVWEVLTDVRRAAETLSGVTSVQTLTDGPYAEGTRWRETRTIFGRSSTEEMWVTLADPLRETEVRASSGGADYVTTFVLVPVSDEATELSVTFSAELSTPSAMQKLGMKVFGGMATKATRKALEQDLADIATAAEGSRRQ